MKDNSPEMLLASEPAVAEACVLWAGLDRTELRKQQAAGELQELEFEAIVFRSAYPNWNYVRFRAEEMDAFAASFVGVPFLRNHDMQDIAARDGIVTACWMDGPDRSEMHAQVRLTTEEGIRDFLAGRIDRFSISWFKRGATLCSVCSKDVFGSECPHVPGRMYPVHGHEQLCEMVQIEPLGREISAVNVPASAGTQILSELLSALLPFKEHIMEQPIAEQVAPIVSAPRSAPTTSAPEEPVAPSLGRDPAGALALVPPDLLALRADLHAELKDLKLARSRLQLETALEGSGLPDAAQNLIRQVAQQAGGGQQPECLDMAEVDRLIAAQKAVLAAAAQPTVVSGLHPLTARDLRTGLDDMQEALDWCLGVQGGPVPPPSLRNVRDVYLAVTGDVDFYGVYNPDHSRLSAASTTTLPGLARNSLNKVVRQHYDNLATFRWYERIVDVVAHDGSTQDIDLVMVDGLANLPTVAEGAAYTEAVTGDARESMAFGKRGVYVGITLEMFRRSDIAKMQAIPRELVKAAIRTRSAAIGGIFTAASGAGPTMVDDSTALFHANHSNLATVAFSAAEWAAARKRIFSQTVPGTGSKLGLWPTFALLPVDLYDTALEVFGYGTGDVGKPNSGGTAQTVNPYGESRLGDPRPIPVVVPEWTDATDWAQIVDPRLHPVIQMAYASAPQGGIHALPEIYEVRSETAGLMFTNDTLPIKIRDWWAYGVATHVGVGKNNVAS
ncbi:MAG: hypothetical protein U1E16_00070 [Hyphomicrobiales bacterium]